MVHQLLDRFAEFCREGTKAGSDYGKVRANFPLRRELLAALDVYCTNNLNENPRVDVQQLRAKVDLDACTNAFRTAAPRLWTELQPVERAKNYSPSSKAYAASLPVGTEMWLEVVSPRIAGQIDVVARGLLIDYKTGAPKEAHWLQLRFYALLHWLRFQKRVRVLRLIYTDARNVLDQDAPTETELARYAEDLRIEIQAIDSVLMSGVTPPAKPAPDVCRTCHVRQLCTDYWASLPRWVESADLTLSNEEGISFPTWCDIEVRFLSPVAPIDGYDGPASADPWGAVVARVGVSKCPAASEYAGARFLGARVVKASEETEVIATRDTEVFWLPREKPGLFT